MGVSYFSCDKCGKVMNDHGGETSVHAEYETKTGWIEGIFCDSCVFHIRRDRVPTGCYLNALFVMQVKFQDEIKEDCFLFKEVTKESLRDLKKKLLNAAAAFFVVLDEDDSTNEDDTSDADADAHVYTYAQKIRNAHPNKKFEPPAQEYAAFIRKLAFNDAHSKHGVWILPPQWASKDKLKKSIERREVRVEHLKHKLQEETHTLSNKKSKYALLYEANE